MSEFTQYCKKGVPPSPDSVWYYFLRGPSSAQCTQCKKILKLCKSSTKSLRHHLLHLHGVVANSDRAPKDPTTLEDSVSTICKLETPQNEQNDVDMEELLNFMDLGPPEVPDEESMDKTRCLICFNNPTTTVATPNLSSVLKSTLKLLKLPPDSEEFFKTTNSFCETCLGLMSRCHSLSCQLAIIQGKLGSLRSELQTSLLGGHRSAASQPDPFYDERCQLVEKMGLIQSTSAPQAPTPSPGQPPSKRGRGRPPKTLIDPFQVDIPLKIEPEASYDDFDPIFDNTQASSSFGEPQESWEGSRDEDNCTPGLPEFNYDEDDGEELEEDLGETLEEPEVTQEEAEERSKAYLDGRTNPIWIYFLRSSDKVSAKCRICSKILLQPKGSTKSLGYHIERVHKIKYKRLEASQIPWNKFKLDQESETDYSSEESDESTPKKSKKRQSSKVKYTEYRKKEPKSKYYVPKPQFECPMQPCPYKTNREELLKKHVDRHNGIFSNQFKDKIPCDVCGRLIRGDRMQRHQRIHNQERPYVCHHCGKTFRAMDQLTEHIAIHDGNYPYKCDLCSKGFFRPSKLKIHKEKDHGPNAPPPPDPSKKYNCSVCNKVFNGLVELNYHTEKHIGREPKCPICGEIFTSQVEYKVHHHSVHQGGEVFQCDKCSKFFMSKSKLNYHFNVIHGYRSEEFKCSVCGRQFDRKTSLQTHMYIHTGEKPYTCEFCGKGFITPAKVRTHVIAMHTEEKRHECKICGKKFKLWNYLYMHLRNSHKRNAKEETPQTFLTSVTSSSKDTALKSILDAPKASKKSSKVPDPPQEPPQAGEKP